MIIDFRVRPPIPGFVDAVMYRAVERTSRIARNQWQRPPRVLTEPTWEVFEEEFAAAGIHRGVVPGRHSGGGMGAVTNEDIADAVRRSDGKLIGFAAVDQESPDAADVLRHAVDDLGFRGLALDPGFGEPPRYVDDPALAHLFEVCRALDVPVMVTLSGAAGPDVSYADPLTIDRLAAQQPDLKIIVAHGSWPFVMPLLGVAFRRLNVYVSPDQYLIRLPGWRDYVDAANTFLADRLLFGSSYPFMPFDGALEQYRTVGFADDVVPKVLGGNAARLLGL